MLNISENRIKGKGLESYSSFKIVTALNTARKLAYWVMTFFILLIIILLLPWTQNMTSKGKVTTLRPEQRPQSVYSVIDGRIEKWYVREGQMVQKGDTLAYITEVKSEYFDPQLLERTQQQVNAKQASRSAYSDKRSALGNQLQAMQQALRFKQEQNQNKIQQYRLKVVSDSNDVIAAQTALDIATYQYQRTDTLYQKGIKSLTDLENKRNKMQEKRAKLISLQNKLLSSRNDWLNAIIARSAITSEYADKMAKVRSQQSSASSNIYDAESQIAKLENKYSNYSKRTNYYYILAPQDGYITEIYKKGIGETVKTTEPLLAIMPSNYELAVEAFVLPMNYPLLRVGQEVRFIFDGWPAFVFSGWPDQSYGTFAGKIFAIDIVANKKGKYRILIAPDENDKPWPDALRVGTGARGMILLNDVPLWYEFWRQLNGFPPDYYNEEGLNKVKLKAPANHLKK